MKILRDKGFCYQCLLPGANSSQGKHHEGRCQRDFIYPYSSHSKYPVKNHVLVCDKHKDDAANQEVLGQFKERCMKSSSLPSFSREIKLAFHTEHTFTSKSSKDSINNKGIYLLQSIKVNSNKLNIFYDNGYSDFIVSENAAKLLGKYAKKQNADPIQLGGVGNMRMESLGAYNVTIPQYNGQMVTLSGLCIRQIISDFPIYALKDVENDIQQHYTSSGGTNSLPKLPSAVGGEIHLMIESSVKITESI